VDRSSDPLVTDAAGLLDELERLASLDSTPIADLLRRAAILASRLDFAPFKAWVSNELNGYPDVIALPGYRRDIGGRLMVQLIGPFGHRMTNVPVPLSQVPDEFRQRFTKFDFVHGVAEIRRMVDHAAARDQGALKFQVPQELGDLISIYDGYSTVSIWSEVSVHSVADILEQVRNRTLMFALGIHEINPRAGNLSASDPHQVSAQAAAGVFGRVFGSS